MFDIGVANRMILLRFLSARLPVSQWIEYKHQLNFYLQKRVMNTNLFVFHEELPGLYKQGQMHQVPMVLILLANTAIETCM